MQAGVNQIYARFTGLVAQARHLPIARVNEIGQGRVWEGTTAKSIGLIDGFGSLDDAIAEAARRAKLDPANVHPVYVEREPSAALRFFRNLIDRDRGDDDDSSDAWAALATRPDAILGQAFGDVRMILSGPVMQVRCLSCPPVAPPARVPATGCGAADPSDAVTLTIRPVSPEDAEAIAAIYAPYVAETVVSFEEQPPTPDEMRERIAATTATHPWIRRRGGWRAARLRLCPPLSSSRRLSLDLRDKHLSGARHARPRSRAAALRGLTGNTGRARLHLGDGTDQRAERGEHGFPRGARLSAGRAAGRRRLTSSARGRMSPTSSASWRRGWCRLWR